MEQKNIMLCDPETGICGVPAQGTKQETDKLQFETTGSVSPVRILYFTDPICSSCWGIEPQLRKLELEYGDHFQMEYIMGGLLPSWETYGGRDVRNPQEVAAHWEEAGVYYDMPLDGDVWLIDPLHSSYPPSVAVKAAQLQDDKKAKKFLRRIREMVFLEKKNITRWGHLVQAALETGLDIIRFREDYQSRAAEMFQQDLKLRAEWGVRGFPTLFFTDGEGNRLKITGSRTYEEYEGALLQLLPGAKKKALPASYETVFSLYPTLTAKEFSVLTGKGRKESDVILEYLEKRKEIERVDTGKGFIWTTAGRP